MVIKKLIVLGLICLCMFSVVGVTMSVMTDKDSYIQGEPIQVWVVMEPEGVEDVKFFDVKARVVVTELADVMKTFVYFKDVKDVATAYSDTYSSYPLFTGNGVNTDASVDYNSAVDEGKYGRWISYVDSAQEQLTVEKNTIGNTVLYSGNLLEKNQVLPFILTLDGDKSSYEVEQVFPVPQTKLVNYIDLVEQPIAFNVQSKLIKIKAGCTEASDCDAGKKCVSVDATKPNVCSSGDSGSGCAGNVDCKAGLICIDNKCGGAVGDSCVDAMKCASGFCVGGKCTSGLDGADCAGPGDCKSKVCTNGKCVGNGGDADGDGVDDSLELPACKNTPKGFPVWKTGPFAGCLLGDLTLDGSINAQDVNLFVFTYNNQDDKSKVTFPHPADLGDKTINVLESSDVNGFIYYYNNRP